MIQILNTSELHLALVSSQSIRHILHLSNLTCHCVALWSHQPSENLYGNLTSMIGLGISFEKLLGILFVQRPD
jgi:hypothetical protein